MRTLVVDLDGTLVDTLQDLSRALAPVLTGRGFAPLTPEEVRPLVGDGLAALLARALAARGAAPAPGDMRAFGTAYERVSGAASRLYPDAESALDRLASTGWRLAICTNKAEVPARQLLDRLGVAGRFGAICGGDTFPVRKPDPAHILLTVERAGGHATRAVMVGDLAHDLRAARGAGVRSIWAAWGYGAPATGELADAAAPDWRAVPAIAQRSLGTA